MAGYSRKILAAGGEGVWGRINMAESAHKNFGAPSLWRALQCMFLKIYSSSLFRFITIAVIPQPMPKTA